MQSGNLGAAQDALALLATCLDQAVIDNGRFELAGLLTLAEDPPSSIFINRYQGPLSRSRTFSQLADPKWVTVALAYVKEQDVIATKRQELTGNVPDKPHAEAKAKNQPKRRAKGGGRGGGAQKNQDAEEEQ